MCGKLTLIFAFSFIFSMLCNADKKSVFFIPVYADSEEDLRNQFNATHGAIPFRKFSYKGLDFICVTPVRGGAAGIKDVAVFMRREKTKWWSLVLFGRTVSASVVTNIEDELLKFTDDKGNVFLSMRLNSEMLCEVNRPE